MSGVCVCVRDYCVLMWIHAYATIYAYIFVCVRACVTRSF